MLGPVRTVAAVAAAISLIAGSGVSFAASAMPAPKIPALAPAPTANPWLALSAMTYSTNATAAAALSAESQRETAGQPPALPLAVVLATIATAIYILLDDDDQGGRERTSNSQASGPSPLVAGLQLRPAPISPN